MEYFHGAILDFAILFMQGGASSGQLEKHIDVYGASCRDIVASPRGQGRHSSRN